MNVKRTPAMRTSTYANAALAVVWLVSLVVLFSGAVISVLPSLANFQDYVTLVVAMSSASAVGGGALLIWVSRQGFDRQAVRTLRHIVIMCVVLVVLATAAGMIF